MSVPLSHLVRRVLPSAPGCPAPLAEDALRDAADEFCRRTLIWREELPAIDVAGERGHYPLPTPGGARVHMILSASLAGRALTPVSEEWLRTEWPGWEAYGPGTPCRYLPGRPAGVRLLPTPARDMPGALVVRAALAPAPDADALPDDLADDFAAALAHGALAQLLAMAGRPFAAPELAPHHARQFRAAVNDARAGALRGNTPTSLAARPRSFL